MWKIGVFLYIQPFPCRGSHAHVPHVVVAQSLMGHSQYRVIISVQLFALSIIICISKC